MLKDGIMKRSDQTRYADDYVEFVDDMKGGFVLRENYLVKSTEIRVPTIRAISEPGTFFVTLPQKIQIKRQPMLIANSSQLIDPIFWK